MEKIELQLKISQLLQTRSGLPRFATKLKNKEPLLIGFLGGSITLAEGYRPMVTNMLQEKYLESRISSINGGVGGTGSSLGTFRLYRDILRYNPDLIFIEFAVNDCDITPEHSLAAIEGIVLQIKQFDPEIDICFIYTINSKIREKLESGEQYWTIKSMEKVAEHYNIPSINLALEVVAQEKNDLLVFHLPRDPNVVNAVRQSGKLVFSHDSVHPTLDDGHSLYCKIIMMSLEKLISILPKTISSESLDTLSTSPWSKVKILPLNKLELSKHWSKTTLEQENFSQMANISQLTELWKTEKPGAKIHFKFKGTGFGLLGIFGLNSGQFRVWCDGKEYSKVALFDKYSNRYRVHYAIIDSNLPDKEHEVILLMDSSSPDHSILSPNYPIDNPEKLKGLVAYIDSILIIGCEK